MYRFGTRGDETISDSDFLKLCEPGKEEISSDNSSLPTFTGIRLELSHLYERNRGNVSGICLTTPIEFR